MRVSSTNTGCGEITDNFLKFTTRVSEDT